MKTLQLYAAATSTGADNVASIQIPGSTKVREVIIQGSASSAATVLSAELSQSSTSQFTTNNAQNVIGRLMGACDLTAGAPNSVVLHPNCALQAGQTVYLHVNSSVSSAWRVCVTLVIE